MGVGGCGAAWGRGGWAGLARSGVGQDGWRREAVLHVEVSLNAVRFARKNDLTVGDYHNSMMDNNDEVTDKRLIALGEKEKDKIMVAKAYNKNVKAKSFHVGDLVWKTILPLRSGDRKFEKWSLSWEGPYKIT
eukprot:XP_008671696.1 uncharacterized protein LOC103649133 [Zea mays]